MENKMNKNELEIILEKHLAWMYGDLRHGKRAKLEGVNLRGYDLRGVRLRSANLPNAILANADLRYANLYYANLTGADLANADLRHADLTAADLTGADLSGADLTGACLIEAKLKDATLNFPIACPEVGSFIAFKQVYLNGEYFVVKLRIPAQAKRCSATTRKCRASEAKVTGFYKLNGRKSNIEYAYSIYDPGFIYKKGKTITPEKPFCEDRWNECASGIHFFMTFEEAAEY